MEDAQLESGESKQDIEVAPALIAVHPSQDSVAVAVGFELRVFDLRRDCAVILDQGGDSYCKSLRAIRYGAKGKLFVSAGDDKLVTVWSTEPWEFKTTAHTEKKVTAIAISEDGSYVCYADKFGVVWAFSLVVEYDDNAPVPILSHYCSIITSLEFSPDGKYIISADRDFKIRVTIFPKNHEDGAHEIQSFCLGHTEFVTSLAFVCNPDLMVSGSGDSTVRMWDISSGSLLDTCEIGEKAGVSESNGIQPECHYAVTDICTLADGTLLAVAIQDVQGIMLLNCNVSAPTLSFSKVVLISEGTFIPTSIGMSNSTGLLWMVTGASSLPDSDCGNLARVRAISISKISESESDQSEALVLDDNKIPGATKLLEKLQGSLSYSEEAFVAAAEAVKTAMSNLLIKKHYTSENREFRKRTRNDKKTKK